MPRRARGSTEPLFFHVINRAIRRQQIFTRARDYSAFLGILHDGLKRHPVRLISYCLLSNHWHLVMGPVGTAQLSKLMHWVTSTHASLWHRQHRSVGQGPVYQGRFRSDPIESVADLMRVCRHVERNALSAGLVLRAQDWPWCSLSERLRPDCRLPLVSTPFLESRGWLDYVNTARSAREQRPVPKTHETVENRPVPLDDRSQSPSGLVGSVKSGEDAIRVGGAGDENHADPHVERAKHLRVVDVPGLLKPAKERRHRPAGAVE